MCIRDSGPTTAEIWRFFDFLRLRPPPSWIFEISNFNSGNGQEGRTTSPRQISLKSAKTRPRCHDLSIFQDGFAAILDFKNFKFLTFGRSRGSKCFTVPNFIKIGPTTAEIWRFFYFFKMAAAAILDFKNFKFLAVGTVKRVKMRHPAKFRQNRSNHG